MRGGALDNRLAAGNKLGLLLQSCAAHEEARPPSRQLSRWLGTSVPQPIEPEALQAMVEREVPAVLVLPREGDRAPGGAGPDPAARCPLAPRAAALLLELAGEGGALAGCGGLSQLGWWLKLCFHQNLSPAAVCVELLERFEAALVERVEDAKLIHANVSRACCAVMRRGNCLRGLQSRGGGGVDVPALRRSG